MACMRKTTIYLSELQVQRVRRIAAASGRTQAEVIREAIDKLPADARLMPRSIGRGRGGPDLSERSEELLEGFGEKR